MTRAGSGVRVLHFGRFYNDNFGVDLWVKSTEANTDLQVSLTEVRPDGQEMYVQDGWLRASNRKLDEAVNLALAGS